MKKSGAWIMTILVCLLVLFLVLVFLPGMWSGVISYTGAGLSQFIWLKKGGRISNVLIFLCSSVSIRVPLLLFEISSLGLRFAASRFILNLAVVFVIAYSIEGLLPEQEIGHIYRKNKNESGQG